MSAVLRRQADDADGRPRRAAKLAEQIERLTLGPAEPQVGHDHDDPDLIPSPSGIDRHSVAHVGHGDGRVRHRPSDHRPVEPLVVAHHVADGVAWYGRRRRPGRRSARGRPGMAAIVRIAWNSESAAGSAWITPAGDSPGGQSRERFDPTSVAMQGSAAVMASSSAFDMPSDCDGSTKTSRPERKLPRCGRASDEPNPGIRGRAIAQCLGPGPVNQSGDDELDPMRGRELHERLD